MGAMRAVIRSASRAAIVAALSVAVAGCSRAHFVSWGQDDAGADARAPDAPRDASDDAAHEAGVAPLDAGKGDAAVLDAGMDAAAPPIDAAMDASDASDASEPDGGDSGSKDDAAIVPNPPVVEENLRLAFFGDQGFGAASEAVLQLIKSEHADLVIHAGDLDYVDQPDIWEAQVESILGRYFPYFVAVGNHDVPAWAGPGGYQELLQQRLERIRRRGADCTGDLGVNSVCRFRGLTFVLSGVGTYGEGHEDYLADALASAPEAWKLCVWHKNQHDMQVGTKSDEVGWRAYRLCGNHGALILTGHEHSYSRTYALSGVGFPEIQHGFHGPANQIDLEPGATAVVVAGLGGVSARFFAAELHPDISWWASIYARNYQLMNGVETGVLGSVEFGALFIDFHVDGDPHKARAYFKTVSGAIIDSFELTVSP
jgi:predicted phosphodiesterase